MNTNLLKLCLLSLLLKKYRRYQKQLASYKKEVKTKRITVTDDMRNASREYIDETHFYHVSPSIWRIVHERYGIYSHIS